MEPVIETKASEKKPFDKEKEEKMLNVLLKEQEEAKEHEVDAILVDFEDDESDLDKDNFDTESADEKLSADAVEAKLNALMQKEKEQALKSPTSDIFPRFDNPDKKAKPATNEITIKEKIPEEETFVKDVDESQIEALLNEPDVEPEPAPKPIPKEKPQVKTEVIIKDTPGKKIVEEEISESEIEELINVSEEEKPEINNKAEDLKKEVKKVPDILPKPPEVVDKKIPEVEIATEDGIPAMVIKSPDTPKLKMEDQEKVFVKNSEELNKEKKIQITIPPKISDEGISDKNISRDGGIPTIVSKAKKEDKTYDFTISDESGIGSQTQNQPIYPHTQTHTPGTAPDIDSKMGQFRKEGFGIKNIPQAIGFVFNLERLLISTIGITVALLIYLLLQKTLPLGIGSSVGFLVYMMFLTALSAFICFTIIKQINEQIHIKFIHHFSEFKKDMLIPASMFWVFWLAIIIFLGAIVAIITAIGKFGSVGSVIFSLLSPVNFIFAIILFSLVLVSGLLAFIFPAIIAIDKPGVFSMLKEVMYVLKNHLFTILGGFIFNAVLNFFIMIATMFVLIGTYILIGMTLMAINPEYLMKLVATLPPMITNTIPQLQQMAAGGAMMEISGVESLGFGFFIVFMAIGSVFLISIPFIFQNGAAVITFLSIKGKKNILKKDV